MQIAPLPAAVGNALAHRHTGGAGSHFIPNHEGGRLNAERAELAKLAKLPAKHADAYFRFRLVRHFDSRRCRTRDRARSDMRRTGASRWRVARVRRRSP